jgi:anti-sigma regulatory factor (Ser/Thr protein kinase)
MSGAHRGERGDSPGEGSAILDATLDGLRRAAEEVAVERQVAERLQRSLLPAMPTIPGLRLAASYRPGGPEHRIGGDWYDAIPLRSGKIAIAIGDVVGRGVQAAARMAHLQSVLRAYALEGLRPALILERMNAFVLEGEGAGMVTLLCLLVDPGAGSLVVASAGHPPPLIVQPGVGPEFVHPPRGRPLGVMRLSPYTESATTLEPGSTVILYTDGLVEGRDLPLADGLEALRRRVEEGPPEPEALCRWVIGSIDRPEGFRDDVALLAFQLTPPGETVSMTLPTQPASLASLRRTLAPWLRTAGAAEAEVYEILVACGEACANTVAHAHPAVVDAPFEVRAARRGDEIEVAVTDTGRWRDSGREDAGRGLDLMRELMDDVVIESGSAGTTVTMRRRLAAANPA